MPKPVAGAAAGATPRAGVPVTLPAACEGPIEPELGAPAPLGWVSGTVCNVNDIWPPPAAPPAAVLNCRAIDPWPLAPAQAPVADVSEAWRPDAVIVPDGGSCTISEIATAPLTAPES